MYSIGINVILLLCFSYFMYCIMLIMLLIKLRHNFDWSCKKNFIAQNYALAVFTCARQLIHNFEFLIDLAKFSLLKLCPGSTRSCCTNWGMLCVIKFTSQLNHQEEAHQGIEWSRSVQCHLTILVPPIDHLFVYHNVFVHTISRWASSVQF